MKKGVFEKIYEIVKKIPIGKVTTYGEISRYLGIKNPRIVGWALHANTKKDVPCHRVVSKNGKIAKNYAFNGAKKQKERLIKESVGFKDSFRVNLSKYFHKPQK